MSSPLSMKIQFKEGREMQKLEQKYIARTLPWEIKRYRAAGCSIPSAVEPGGSPFARMQPVDRPGRVFFQVSGSDSGSIIHVARLRQPQSSGDHLIYPSLRCCLLDFVHCQLFGLDLSVLYLSADCRRRQKTPPHLLYRRDVGPSVHLGPRYRQGLAVTHP